MGNGFLSLTLTFNSSSLNKITAFLTPWIMETNRSNFTITK